MSDAPILEALNLSKHYESSGGLFRSAIKTSALRDVSLTLRRNQILGVVGESGSGKSTLARQLTMLEKPSSGQLLIEGMDCGLADASQLKRWRPKVQMVFQNPYASLNPRWTVGTTLDEPLLINTSLARSQRRDRIATMLAKVGLRPEHADRYPHMFSGGQRQRVAIARAMILEPNIVVADEPTSALDVSVQAQILNLIRDLRDSSDTSYVFISHNLSVVRRMADEVLVLYMGNVVEYGGTKAVFSQPAHPYTRALMSSMVTFGAATSAVRSLPRERLQNEAAGSSTTRGCAFSSRCPFSTSRCEVQAPLARKVGDRQVACHRAEDLDLG